MISVVIPIYNEERLLPVLYERLRLVLEKLKMPYEIIFVNDASTDSSFSLLEGMHKKDAHVKVVTFSRNFGHQTAVTAGLNYSQGSAVMVIDGDLQDPPEIIPDFVGKWREGFEVVYGVRQKRKENFFKKSAYKIFYRLLDKLSEQKIPLDSGDCSLMGRKVVDLLNAMPERNRFIRGLRSWVGFKQVSLPYERDRRFAGVSKYSFFKLLKLAFDGILSFSGVPLRLSIVTGFFIASFSVVYSFYVIIKKLFFVPDMITGWSSLMAVLAFLGGLQLLVVGFVGEYILRIYDEVKGRPHYVVASLLGLEKKSCGNG